MFISTYFYTFITILYMNLSTFYVLVYFVLFYFSCFGIAIPTTKVDFFENFVKYYNTYIINLKQQFYLSSKEKYKTKEDTHNIQNTKKND